MVDKIHLPYLYLMPEDALKKPFSDTIRYFETEFGEDFKRALDPEYSTPSPHHERTDTKWIKLANTVGINVRTIGSFWNIIPYSLTLSRLQDAIHILPIWEPGVVASLYGPASWNINPEFYSEELAQHYPELDTVEKQLKVVVNLLHLLGKSVGMDVVPHTDRYSEMVLANPNLFEWLQRRDMEILRHNNNLWKDVRALLFEYVQSLGPAIPQHGMPASEAQLFEEMPEDVRLEILFGQKDDYWGRLNRRKEMVELLYQTGFETVPATMGPPYRGIEVDPDPAAKVVDEEGRVWRDYRISKPEKFSRVFGPLARYKLYESLDDNANWQLDFKNPNIPAWDYVCRHYRAIQAEYGFDFMRGDMAHVQMRPDGVPYRPDAYYDLLGAVKQRVLEDKPYFGYFAESFLAPPGEMAYGDEVEHLRASFADSTLGDLQAEPVDTAHFMAEFARYREILEKGKVAPNFTVMTADKDDPRFDSFYHFGNEARLFMSLFLTDMPSYVALGFECRDPHPVPAPNEHYTKLYVFQVQEGPKATKGPYVWGKNRPLHHTLVRIKALADNIGPEILHEKVQWLLGPDQPDAAGGLLFWTQAPKPIYLFGLNLSNTRTIAVENLELPEGKWMELFALEQDIQVNAAIGHLNMDMEPNAITIWRRLED